MRTCVLVLSGIEISLHGISIRKISYTKGWVKKKSLVVLINVPLFQYTDYQMLSQYDNWLWWFIVINSITGMLQSTTTNVYIKKIIFSSVIAAIEGTEVMSEFKFKTAHNGTNFISFGCFLAKLLYFLSRWYEPQWLLYKTKVPSPIYSVS